MERAIEIYVMINCAVIGISHLVKANAWIDFFAVLRSYGKAGAIANGFLSLSLGAIILAFHWTWQGAIPIMVTSLGIAQVIKALVAFALPELSLKTMDRPMAKNPVGYQIGGVFLLLFAIAIAFSLWG